MESYNFILFVAIILISTKVLGLISKRVHLPAVVGSLLAGVILAIFFEYYLIGGRCRCLY